MVSLNICPDVLKEVYVTLQSGSGVLTSAPLRSPSGGHNPGTVSGRSLWRSGTTVTGTYTRQVGVGS